MNIIVNEIIKKDEKKYPYLGVNRHGCISLFFSPIERVILKSAPAAEYYTPTPKLDLLEFSEVGFEPFKGQIILEN